jgi:hypothetical protein
MPVSEKGALFYLIGGLILFSTSFKERAFLFFFTPMATSKSPTCGRVKIPHLGTDGE